MRAIGSSARTEQRLRSSPWFRETNGRQSLTARVSPEDTLPLVSRIELEKARISLKDAEAKEKAAAARLQSAQAELKGLEEQATFYTLRAPIAGRLGLIHAMPGQTLAAGTIVAEVVALDEIDVLCFAAPDMMATLKLDQEARLTGLDHSVLDEASSPTGRPPAPAICASSPTRRSPKSSRTSSGARCRSSPAPAPAPAPSARSSPSTSATPTRT